MDKRKSGSGDKTDSLDKIIDLSKYRKNKSEERRRECERILFNRVLGVYSFAEKVGLHHIEVVDISFSGIRFREDRPEHPLRVADKVPLRFYFTPSSYLRMLVEIKRVSPFEIQDRQGLEYGCELDKNTKCYEVLKELIGFIAKYSEFAVQDNNPPMLWF